MMTGRTATRHAIVGHRSPIRRGVPPPRVPPPRREGAVSGRWRVGLAQLGIEKTLGENATKIIDFVGRAASQQCRTVVFPEGALDWEPETPRPAIDEAIEAMRRAAARHRINVIAGA